MLLLSNLLSVLAWGKHSLKMLLLATAPWAEHVLGGFVGAMIACKAGSATDLFPPKNHNKISKLLMLELLQRACGPKLAGAFVFVSIFSISNIEECIYYLKT